MERVSEEELEEGIGREIWGSCPSGRLDLLMTILPFRQM